MYTDQSLRETISGWKMFFEAKREIDLPSIDSFSFQSSLRKPIITVNDIKTASSVRNCRKLQMTLLLFYPLSVLFLERIPKTRTLSRQQSCAKLVFVWKSNFSTDGNVEKGRERTVATEQLSINLHYSLPHSCRWLLPDGKQSDAAGPPKKRAVSFES